MKTSLISIVIPTYNRAHLIVDTLNSVLAQTYTNWECIVVDDGSTDNTNELMKTYLTKDIRIRYYHRPKEKKKGANACRNYGFELSKGEYIQFFDSDDLMAKSHLKKKIKILEKTKLDYSICRSQNFVKSLNNKGWISNLERKGDIFDDYISGRCTILTFTPLWRKTILTKGKLFDETISQSQDLELYSRILFENKNIAIIDEILIYVRYNHESITTSNGKNKYHIKSYLEVRKRILELDRTNKKIQYFILKSIIKTFRNLLSDKNYKDCDEFIKFMTSNYLHTTFWIAILRIKYAYIVIKNIGFGETRFKKVFKI